jgi:bifunctional non-homologous end joining protein LigD
MAAILQRYRQKRDFRKTPEPEGGRSSSGEPSFVIQKHAASHLHYDFRLESGGVLKSWAVPKGPSTDPQVKRLAMEVEDHPLDYAGFEGVIPQGEYGGGNVIVWDRGTYRNITTHHGRPISFEEGLKRGHIAIALNGEKLHGGFALTRTRSGPKPAWLLLKMNDAEAHHPENPVETRPESVISGRGVEQMNGGDRVWRSNRPPKKNWIAPAAAPPTGIVPMLATLVDEPFNLPGWIYEPKLDGERCLAFREGDEVGLFSRNQKVLNAVYPELLAALKKQKAKSFIVDGEIVAFEPGTEITSFRRLQQRMHLQNAADVARSPVQVHYYLFDLLYAGGRDLRRLPLKERKALLEKTIRAKDPVRINSYVDHDGDTYYRQACRKGWEGLIAKRLESPYAAGRSRDWLKFKCVSEQEFLIGGYSEPQGSREVLGSILIGYFDGDRLKFAGKVGTGFDTAMLRLLKQKLKPLEQKEMPFDHIDIPRRSLHWVKPRLIAQVGFTEWTEDGKLRHPRFLGLRDDKAPQDITREQKAHTAAVRPEVKTPAAPAVEAPQPIALAKSKPSSTAKPAELRIGERVLHLSNLNKVLYPATGFTKGEVLNYYIQVGPTMLPHLSHRPLTMKRYPSGVDGEFFYEKEAPRYRPHWLKTFAITETKTTNYVLVNDLASLIWIANLACLEFHTLLARAPKPGRPTMIAFDFDPGAPADIFDCARVAFEVRELLASLKLKSFIKTSGSKGLHLYIPLNTPVTYEQTKEFAHAVALLMEKRDPKRIVSNMSKALRGGKVFIDWSQNTQHKTTCTAYSLRARSEPTVSTPITWEELGNAVKKKDAASLKFLPATVLKRLQTKGDLFAPVQTLQQKLPSLARLR